MTRQELQALNDFEFAALAFALYQQTELEPIKVVVTASDGVVFIREIPLVADDVLVMLSKREKMKEDYERDQRDRELGGDCD
jgi:hypothetical protein